MSEWEARIKRCPGCDLDKPLCDFSVDLSQRDKLSRRCRSCTNAAARARREKRLAAWGREIQKPVSPEEVIANGKKCPDCGEVKASDEFGRNKGYPDGHGFYCKPCTRVRAKRTYRERVERQGRKIRERVAVQPGFKWCPSCKQAVLLEKWDKNRQTKDGLASECKACRKERGARDHLKRSYGLTPEDVRKMFEFQDGLCAICCERPAEHVDHDHETGEVRELLCFNCNTLLGKADDDWRRLQRAQSYLLWHKLGHIPVAEGV
ncbi:endonuclease domain-containing protein [Actinocorallia sp. B10E7]|uniref:endonuclease VII domain-containing protein n=1 Tax=Actinocorallia sp. B10E7 TaxID=3153558 RepID=UPI00325E23E9